LAGFCNAYEEITTGNGKKQGGEKAGQRRTLCHFEYSRRGRIGMKDIRTLGTGAPEDQGYVPVIRKRHGSYGNKEVQIPVARVLK
jgi:hypothetical protein